MFAGHQFLNSFVWVSASQLKPEEVEFHIKENREAHKTDDYEAEQLIIRRGQTFDVTVTFNREYKPDSDVIVLQFVTGWQISFTKREYRPWNTFTRINKIGSLKKFFRTNGRNVVPF